MPVAMISANPGLTDTNEWVSPSLVNNFLLFLSLCNEYFYIIISLLNKTKWENITCKHHIYILQHLAYVTSVTREKYDTTNQSYWGGK